MSYKERYTAPEKNNKFYTYRDYGGYSSCCLGNTEYIAAPWKGCTLPNCVGYAIGRFNEIIGCWKYGIPGNAEQLYTNAQKMGLKVGQTPKPGALMVWQGGNSQTSADGCGHVVIVSKVISPTEVIVEESGWSSTKPFWTARHKKGANGLWIEGDDKWMTAAKYPKFMGFIYNPAVEDKDCYVVCDLNVLCYGDNVFTVKAVNSENTNYIRLRDFEEVLHLCGIGYYNGTPTLNGKRLNMKDLNVINIDGTNYVRMRDFEDKLHLCKVEYNSSKKMPEIIL